MPPSDCEQEFLDIVQHQVKLVAIGFAKRRGRLRDALFVEECIAEAWYVTVVAIWTNLEGIKVKFPDDQERYKFYRMMVGYHLKSFVSYRAKQTISYLKKKGIVEEHVQLEDEMTIQYYSPIDDLIIHDDAIRNPIERMIVEFYCNGLSIELIAEKLEWNIRRIRKTLARVKKRLTSN